MSDKIPPDLILKILSRLSLQHVLCFRLVCKSWYSIINDPYFAKLHSNYQYLCKDDDDDIIGYLMLKHHHDNNKVSLLSLDDFHEIKNISIPCSHKYIVSCNGLILLRQSESKQLLSIWNPLTKELQKLPRTPNLLGFLDFDFGYDSVSYYYKVLIFQTLGLKSYLWVYSLKLDSWKQVHVDFPCIIARRKSGVSFNGALHRTAAKSDFKSLVIVAFDLETDNCRFYQVPSSCKWSYECDLVKVHGYLSISNYKGNDRLEIWLMKEYGSESSWMKLFSVKESILKINDRFQELITAEIASSMSEELARMVNYLKGYGLVKIISYSKNKRSFLVEKRFRKGNNYLCWFNLDNKIIVDERLCKDMKVMPSNSGVFIPNLVRIKGK